MGYDVGMDGRGGGADAGKGAVARVAAWILADREREAVGRAALGALGDKELLGSFADAVGRACAIGQGEHGEVGAMDRVRRREVESRAGMAAEEWLARGLGAAALERVLEAAGAALAGEGLWDWCRRRGLPRTANTVARAEPASWCRTKAFKEAGHLPWADSAPGGLAPLALTAFRVAVAAWRDPDWGGQGARSGKARECLRELTKFACCSESSKAEVASGVALAAKALAKARMGEAECRGARHAAGRLRKAFAAGGMSGMCEEAIGEVVAAADARLARMESMRAAAKPWTMAAKAAIACDGEQAALHLVEEAARRGLPLAEGAGDDFDEGDGTLLHWALSASAWRCVAMFARMGFQLGRRPGRAIAFERGPFEEFVAAEASPGAREDGDLRREAFIELGRSLARGRLAEFPGEGREEAAERVEAMASEAWRLVQPQFAQARARWEAACMELSLDLRNWVLGVEGAAPPKGAPRL